ncbi:hypothetical protein [Legionella sp. km772]|uniref:hypothetical protein n=1 Tax=Legionella sp. km772 TaxID=2498111 RepID=UPI000F8DF91E|nr:hypothetical protein [Legionella sp. km772]RUR04068.1 hypothetical protein ELY15_15870 [Legionella sp. km772]
MRWPCLYNDKQDLVFKIIPNGAVSAYSYDCHGNRVREIIYLGNTFDISALTKDSTILLGTVSTWCTQQNQAAIALMEWTYNSFGQVVEKIQYATIANDGTGIKDSFATYFSYDWTIHNELSITERKLNEAETAITSIERDGLSRIVKEINPLGQTAQYSYKGNQYQRIFEPTGLLTLETYNASGRLVLKEEKEGECSSKVIFIEDIVGRVCITTNEKNDEEYLIYDEYDRVIFRIDSLLRVTQHIYDANDYLLHRVRYASVLDNIDLTALKEGTYLPEPIGDYCIESSIHDAKGRLLGTIDGDNFLTTHLYDELGNKVETIQYSIGLELTKEQRVALVTHVTHGQF